MLMGLGAGALPAKWTVPRTPDVVVGAGPPALTRFGRERQTATPIAKHDKNFFLFIEHYLKWRNGYAGGETRFERLMLVASGLTWVPEWCSVTAYCRGHSSPNPWR